MAAVPNPSDLTRHQLDELDALLQRMLALPLNGGAGPSVEAKPPSAATKWRIDPPHAAPSLPLTLQALQAPQVVPEAIAAAVVPPSMPVSYSIPARPPKVEATAEIVERPSTLPLFGPPPRIASPDAEPRTLRGVDAPPVVAKPMTAASMSVAAPIELVQVPADASFAAAQAEITAPVPVLAWPLFAFNWILETTLSLFGPLGQGVTAPAAKNLLGICGLFLLAAAGLWCARGMGYVAW